MALIASVFTIGTECIAHTVNTYPDVQSLGTELPIPTTDKQPHYPNLSFAGLSQMNERQLHYVQAMDLAANADDPNDLAMKPVLICEHAMHKY